MHKKILLYIFLIHFFILFQKQIYAESDFSVSANVEYKVLENSHTAVTHTITIKNTSTYRYAKSYILELTNLEPNNIKAYEEGSPIPYEIEIDDEKYILELNFNEPLTGKDKSRTFVVTYEEEYLAQLNGEVWEVFVPKLSNKYQNYKIVLSVPNSFGQEALISPESLQKIEDGQRSIYIFDGKDLEKSGINAVFGKFQTYSLKLIYHLKNPEDKKINTEIALPPDTSTQRVFYSNITPTPLNVDLDFDGNWIAYYELLPKKDLEVTVEGYTQVFANPIKFLTPYPTTILENLKSQKYWEVDDPKIKEIAMHLKTPQAIYKFVTDNLTYNYDRVKPDVERLGAKQALSATNNVICTEFTDLFIALSRAAGIPAREINGFAYSENPNLQPLSLISDVLHSWPEYWDETRQNWIPVDPTWESTSKIDYFNKFDLKHIAFVIHGNSSTQPLSAGSYKSDNLSKDVHVEFSTLPEKISNSIEINYYIKNNINPFKKSVVINIKNIGISAIYSLSPKIIFPNEEKGIDVIPVLPPFSMYSTYFEIPIGLFGVKSLNKISVNTNYLVKDIYLNKTAFATQQLLVFLSLLIFIIVFIGLKTRKINIYNILKRINLLNKK